MRIVPFFLGIIVIFVLGCEDDTLRKVAERKSLVIESPLVGDISEACYLCNDPSEVIVHRAPFKVLKPYHKIMVIDSGTALSQGVVLQSVVRQTNFIGNLYQEYLERMQADGGDSAYFTGEIILKLSINENGPIDWVTIVSSTTGNSQFDNEIRDSVRTWHFPKAEGKTVVTFPLKFVKTKYSRGDIEIVKISF